MTIIMVLSIIVVMTTQSLATVKAQLSKYVEDAVSTHDEIVITRNGVPAAVLMSYEEHERLVDTLEILSDPQLVADILQARKPDSPSFTTEDILADLKARQQ